MSRYRRGFHAMYRARSSKDYGIMTSDQLPGQPPGSALAPPSLACSASQLDPPQDPIPFGASAFFFGGRDR